MSGKIQRGQLHSSAALQQQLIACCCQERLVAGEAVSPANAGEFPREVPEGTTEPSVEPGIMPEPPEEPEDQSTTVVIHPPVAERGADLEVTQEFFPAVPGETPMPPRFVINVINHGPSLARNVIVEDILPQQIVAAGGFSTSKGHWIRTSPGLPRRAELGGLEPGERVILGFSVQFGADVGGSVVNAVSVNSDTPDPAPEKRRFRFEIQFTG
jgi:hypothetical protein